MTRQRHETHAQQLRKFWDSKQNIQVVQILPGQCYASSEMEQVTTVLGSCISVCLHDEIAGVGGMNHFMLPGEGDGSGNEEARFGTHAMEIVINDMLKLGAVKARLSAKIFGGGMMFPSEQGIGKKNTLFAKNFLSTECITISGEDVGLAFSRKIRFNPKTGKVMVKKLRSIHNKLIHDTENAYATDLKKHDFKSNVELF
jgi:chemotaxis protein CheD